MSVVFVLLTCQKDLTLQIQLIVNFNCVGFAQGHCCTLVFDNSGLKVKFIMTFGANQTNPHGFYQCLDCLHIFSKEEKLKLHMKAHTNERPYSCDTCDYKSKTSGAMNRHKMTHTGEKPLECDKCGYKSRTKSHLAVHKRTHTGEKPFECSKCGHKSRTKSSLTVHERTHTGEKPHSCDLLCGAKFVRKKEVKLHMMRHHM